MEVIMSRLHSSKKGQSGSTKPVRDEAPDWVDHDEEEVEKLVTKLAEKDYKPSEIGMKLRDEYGIPDVKQVTGKKITEILDEHDLSDDIPEDLMSLMEKAARLQEHLEDNPKDLSAKRGLQLTNSKIRRLAKYYRKEGKLEPDWKYDPDEVSLFIE